MVLSVQEKLLRLGLALAVFALVVVALLLLANLFRGRRGARGVAGVFLLPTLGLVSVGLLYPAGRTLFSSFNSYSESGARTFRGLDNYQQIFTDTDQLLVLRNTVLWVVVTPFVATAVGLIYAILIDGSRFESASKALVFLPMSISFVGASIIWKFVYDYRQAGSNQIGLLNQVLVWLGLTPQQWLLNSPLNTFLLVVIMIWIQAGFAMTVLSAAIKAIPGDIVEAARLDGVNSTQMFWKITIPSIRPSLIVVLTTISIATLKVFDIVAAMTGGNFKTSVVANEFYLQTFVYDNQGLGAALAIVLFLLVLPIVIYNVRQLRQTEAAR